MVQISLPKRSLIPVSSGPPFIRMPMSLLKIVTRANDKEKFHNGIRCLKTPSKFVKSLTFGALTLWARSRLHEGTSCFRTTFRNWNNLVCPCVLVWRILETIVDEFMIRFGVNVSLDSGFPLNSFGGSNNPMLELIDTLGMLHLQGRLFESRGCQFLVCRDDIDSREFAIYEMMKGCSVWMVRYLVNTDDFMTSLPERWSIRSTACSIGLGEREKDSFSVINLSGKFIKYNLISKSISQIFDIRLNQMDDDDYEFFLPYTVAHNPYEFIMSFTRKFFGSRGCLLLVCRDNISFREFTIYEMMKGCSMWSVRYLVNTEELMNPLLEGWLIRSIVWSIGYGEKEEDDFLVINLFRKVIKYNKISKTINEIFDIGSNQMDDDDDDDDVEFIRPFSIDLNIMSSFRLLQVCNLVLEFVH
nr:hypothetical protein [Tanacetum cinerariifolium]